MEEPKQEQKDNFWVDFLMTYGWAILVVIASITALIYFGVLNIDGCGWKDVTPVVDGNRLVGAVHWENTISKEKVICPVVAPDLVTEQCKEIQMKCEKVATVVLPKA